MKFRSVINPVLFTGLILILLFGCKKNAIKEIVKNAPTIKVSTITGITASGATIKTEITSDGGDSITARGICWSTTQNPTITDHITIDGKGIESFTSTITGLAPSVTYYFKAYATNSIGTVYGTELTSATLASTPVLSMSALTEITLTTVKYKVNITSDRGSAVLARGICWSTKQTPTITDNVTTDGTGTGIFTGSIKGLSPNVIYYVRAYATNSIGISYSSQLSFSTIKSAPVITTNLSSAITATSAISGGIIVSDGGVSITEVGICWSTLHDPTVLDSKTRDDIGNSFYSYLTLLMPNTKYYIRAYAKNSIDISYGQEISFTTTASIPKIITAPLFLLTSATASCGGIISDDGGAPVTKRGVCWSKAQNPTLYDLIQEDPGQGIGTFTSNLKGLEPNTTYYLRAYATNSIGTAYSSQISFITTK